MGFKEVNSLDCDVTVSLGGTNRKTGKANPTQVEGYYLGKREVPDNKKKNGVSYIYVLQTSKGNVGVWGKTDLDRKMPSVKAGTMIRITQSGMQKTANGDMYKYKVEADSDNTIEVAAAEASSSYEENEEVAAEETSLDEEEAALDEVVYARPAAPSRTATVPDATRQAKVKALLAGSRKTT